MTAVALGACSAGEARAARPTPAGARREPAPGIVVLRLIDAGARRGTIGNFWIVEGHVRNESADTFDSIEARTQWFDKSGRPVAVDSAPLDRPILRPAETSAFAVFTHVRDDLDSFTVTFRDAHGNALTNGSAVRHSLMHLTVAAGPNGG